MTDIIGWGKRYLLNYKIIDEQHKSLISNINKLFDLLSGNSSDVMILRIGRDLADYSIEHFKTEEDLMALYNYPEASEHINSHNNLRNKIKKIIVHIKNGNMEFISVSLLKFLLDWLQDHILVEDKKLAEYLNNLNNNFID
jgi:hemerythrin